jgi:uncharacterized protein YecT (DUF1311 family)
LRAALKNLRQIEENTVLLKVEKQTAWVRFRAQAVLKQRAMFSG